MSDSNNAEQLDPDVLGWNAEDDGLPGIENYPPERPLGVKDPALLHGGSETKDDLAIRMWRENGDSDEVDSGIRLAGSLRVPSSRPGAGMIGDTEETLIAEEASQTSTPSAEEAAIRIEADPASPES